MRPFFCWITGIILQVCFPLQQLSFVLLLPVIVAVILSLFFSSRQTVAYHTRWVYGMLLFCLFIFMAIQATALAEQYLNVPSHPGWLRENARRLQEYMVGKLDGLRLQNNEKSMLATLTVNYRKALSWELRNQFSATGVAHLLSVSGFHVGIVAAFLSSLFSILPKSSVFRWIRFVLLLLFVWAFAYIAGLSAPSVRAALMLTIYLTGKQLQLRPDRYNTLAAAAFCMLVYNPFYLFDVGFQLSFIAVFFILYLQPRFYRLIEVRNPLIATPWGVLTVTVAAQIGTVFLCSYYFGEVSTVFLFTNLTLSLVATVLIPLVLFYMLMPVGIPGSEWLQAVIEFLTKVMMQVVTRFSQLPGATLSIRFDFVTLICSYLILGFILYYFHERKAWIY
ncbi:MAG: ComEC/Rec2 family competence protein [Tannerella sp.]|nr:ComEC/Rec2 family competence protein [Tannerella sp.]